MELVIGRIVTGNRQLHGAEIVSNVPAGKSFVAETTPRGVDILTATVPEGKKWQIRIDIHVIETDA